MGKGKLAGILILLMLVGAGIWFRFFRGGGNPLSSVEPVTVHGYIGSEKNDFLENEKVLSILDRRYGITIEFRKAGSIEMIDMDHSTMDYLWPSSQVALELYKSRHGGSVKSETIFNSPIVIYSWKPVAEALQQAGLVSLADGGHTEIDLTQLIHKSLEAVSWEELGVDQLYGNLVITSTDPARSNSGNLFSGLAANLLLGETASPTTLSEVLPEVKKLFLLQGMMEHSTGTLFNRYLELGMGSFPLVVGYENQIVEFALQNPDFWPEVKDLLILLYPAPTVFSEHPLIALTEGGERLIKALGDEEIMEIAWREHGFRTGITNDPSELGIEGVPDRVTRIIRMPMPEVMEMLITELE